MKNKILVEALDTYEKYRVRDKELKIIPKKGERFKVTKERLNVLLGNNSFSTTFVKVIEQTDNKEKQNDSKGE